MTYIRSKRRVAESNLTKKAMADSLKALTKEKSFDRISVGEITERAGVNRQTFYYHFKDKYELLEWIYDTEIVAPNLSELSFDNWDEKLCNSMNLLRKNKSFYMDTVRHADEYLTRVFLEKAESIFQSAIEIVSEQIPEKSRLDEESEGLLARFFAYGFCGTIIEWIDTGMRESPEHLTGAMREVLTACEKAAYKYKKGEIEL